jgi:hypothetical protein
VAVAAWALISTAACLVEHGGSPGARWFMLLLLLLGAALVLYGVSGLMRLAVPVGTTGAVLAEAVLVSAVADHAPLGARHARRGSRSRPRWPPWCPPSSSSPRWR